MNKHAIVLLGMLVAGCGAPKPTAPAHQPVHVAETIVLEFVQNVKKDIYREDPYFFQADTEFTTDERVNYFRRLEKYIKNNQWDLYLTIITVYNGTDEMADVTLKAHSGDLVIFMLGYWHDTERWELDAYEFPALTFDRPHDQTFTEYVTNIVDDARDYGVPYAERHTIEDAGVYYIEYK